MVYLRYMSMLLDWGFYFYILLDDKDY